MIILILFAFLGGIVTVLSPCILPILPIILSSGFGGSKARPFGIALGFVGSFTFFTLFLTGIVNFTGISGNLLRIFSVVIIFIFGLTLVVPQFQRLVEILFSKLARFVSQEDQNKNGFWGGIIIGASLGLLWTPCVGPILASVISLALSGQVNGSAILITLAYSLGTAIPMFAIIYGGQNLLQKIPFLTKNTLVIQKVFGLIMILTAVGIFFNFDRKFQAFVLNKFPKYGTGLIRLEDNSVVNNALQRLYRKADKKYLGKPMNEINQVSNYSKAPEIIVGGAWFNSVPLTINELTKQNKVVLVDFWTYTCINCIRTLPYIKNWDEKYRDQGLVIIGVHTPEFEFEKDANNVSEAIIDFGLKYPVVQDNNYATWNAYNNRYWPAKYLIDANGRIRYYHFGEGGYDETEKMIQKLLAEAGKNVTTQIDNERYQIYAKTPETYLGYARMVGFASNVKKNQFYNYSFPEDLNYYLFAFDGEWKVTQEYAEAKAGAKLRFRFNAKNVYLVMKNQQGGKVKVFLDNKKQKTIEVATDKLYTIINLDRPGQHILQLEFVDPGTQVFAFTFG